jgi:hypothetical protein
MQAVTMEEMGGLTSKAETEEIVAEPKGPTQFASQKLSGSGLD